MARSKACLICNGTGEICNTCGEAENVCACPEEEKDIIDCEDCAGTGTPKKA